MLKLFISYSHNDGQHVQDFMRHTAPLRDNGTLEMWYDKDITAGDDFWDRIDEHLADRDIICCFISPYYISSGACKKELQTALELRRKKWCSRNSCYSLTLCMVGFTKCKTTFGDTLGWESCVLFF